MEFLSSVISCSRAPREGRGARRGSSIVRSFFCVVVTFARGRTHWDSGRSAKNARPRARGRASEVAPTGTAVPKSTVAPTLCSWNGATPPPPRSVVERSGDREAAPRATTATRHRCRRRGPFVCFFCSFLRFFCFSSDTSPRSASAMSTRSSCASTSATAGRTSARSTHNDPRAARAARRRFLIILRRARKTKKRREEEETRRS